WRRYREVLTSSKVWLLAPTWIAINASLGLWTSQSIFQLIKEPARQHRNQLLMGGFVGAQIALGLAIGLLVFFAGLAFWGDRFKNLRRTTIILYGIVGGIVCILAATLINHSAGQPDWARAICGLVIAGGLFV